MAYYLLISLYGRYGYCQTWHMQRHIQIKNTSAFITAAAPKAQAPLGYVNSKLS